MSAGHRAVWRWAWRMLRRDLASTILVVALLAVPVAFTTYAVVFVSSTTRPPEAVMGAADFVVGVPGDEPVANEAKVNELVDRFPGSIAVSTGNLRLPGRAQRFDLIAVDATHPTARGYKEMLSGVAPRTDAEVAVSPVLARVADVAVGDTIEVEGKARTIVGLVENPGQTDEAFAVVAPGTMASLGGWSVFVVAPGLSRQEVVGDGGVGGGPSTSLIARDSFRDGTLAAVGVSLFGLLALAEVALVAGAAFAVSARRRQRDLALIASAGATPRQLRSAVVGGALGSGAIGAGVGAGIGLGAARLSTGVFERTGHRMLDGPVVPWGFVGGVVVAAIVAATVAGWWPARAVARQSVVDALAAHRPVTRSTGRSATLGAGMVAVGTTISVIAYRTHHDVIVAISTVMATLGVVLLAPSAVGLLGRIARRLPTSARVAARDLSRNRGRTAAGVAALIVALALPLTVGFATASFDRLNVETFVDRTPRNMALVLPAGPDYVPTGFDATTLATPESIARALPGVTVTPWTVPADDTEAAFGAPGAWVGRAVVPLKREGPDLRVLDLPLTIATSEILAALANPELTAAVVEHDIVSTDRRVPEGSVASLLTPAARIGAHEIAADGSSPPSEETPTYPIHRLAGGAYADAPTTFVSERFARDLGWTIASNGWIVTSLRDITPDQLDEIAAISAAGGLEMIDAGAPSTSGRVRMIVTLIGAANAIAIIAIIVALTRAEVRNDDRLLASIGARPRTRRHRAAATAGLTTLIGAVMAVPASAIPLAGLLSRPEYDWVPPVGTLAGVLVAVPLMATLSTWLFTRSQHVADPLPRSV